MSLTLPSDLATWQKLNMGPVEWLAHELCSYYTSSMPARGLDRELYIWAAGKNLDWAIRWENGERDTIYNELPPEVLMFLQIEPM